MSASTSTADKPLPRHPTNKKPYPHSPAASLVTPDGDLIALTYDALDVEKATKEVASRWAGAAVVFLGMTRDDRTPGTGEDEGSTLRVSRLEYESYTPMAIKVLHAIVHRARTVPTTEWPPADLKSDDLAKLDSELESALSATSLRGGSNSGSSSNGVVTGGSTHGALSSGSIRRNKKHKEDDATEPPPADSIIRIALINRLGPVEVGESSILVAVSSPHRRRAFEVAEWLLEETKRKVPIWKREVRVRADEKADKAKEIQEDGRGWIGLTPAEEEKQGLKPVHAADVAKQGGHPLAMAGGY